MLSKKMPVVSYCTVHCLTENPLRAESKDRGGVSETGPMATLVIQPPKPVVSAPNVMISTSGAPPAVVNGASSVMILIHYCPLRTV